ncbi:FAD-dependent oxidoreductase [Nesterenkonia sp. MY13]|uniref:FAD-dependent oxidoreductase n=1 Tax=Nesterenkonia sedimenti TaxID=1463632 RepID=A0A7X8THR3_9MICC|nr:FAD-dependent oxidoreductase [Nesterenkonia sedimenti]NLS08952.1 FAD-dependent oxidoreductase [Nesterenkonia sedimenti]
MRNGFGSFWLHDAPDPHGPRPRLEGEASADLVIIGGGLSGLWTAYWHAKHSPGQRVVVLEKERVGYGASGRNGGWLSGKTVGLRKNLLKSGKTSAEALWMERRLFAAVDEARDLLESTGVDIGAAKGGWMQIARTPSGMARMRAYVEQERQWGHHEEDVRLLSAQQTAERVAASDLHGAVYSPHAVGLHPAKMMYALAKLCTDLGVEIYEHSEVTDISGDTVQTPYATLRAETTVLATEGYTAALPGRKRQLLPMLSSMIITEPLDPEDLDRIGWEHSELVSCAEHMYFYAQKTADGRIAIGGRGKPYNWGSAPDTNGELNPKTVRQLADTVQELFPQVELTPAHAWCGVLGVSRDWSPFIDYRPESGLLQLGGYAGQGVTASYLAGRTAAELLAGEETELTRSTWVRPTPKNWEPEPLRWLGSNGVYKLYRLADSAERRDGGEKTSALATIGHKVSGR